MGDNKRAPRGKAPIDRIREMEQRLYDARAALDVLDAALDGYEAALPGLRKLEDYYGSGDWRRDFEADEAGLLPADLKRGVLTEDAVYDLLSDRDALRRLQTLPDEN